MAKLILNKKWTTWASVVLAAFLSVIVIALIFTPPIKSLHGDVAHLIRGLQEDLTLLARKPALQSEWESKKNLLPSGVDAETALNLWVKDILALSQSQSVALEKLEPAGIKTGPHGKNLAVFVSFHGDIRKFIHFIYQLQEKDPLSRVESFDARLEEGATGLSFELMLGKTIQ